jgi:hypothetical protein
VHDRDAALQRADPHGLGTEGDEAKRFQKRARPSKAAIGGNGSYDTLWPPSKREPWDATTCHRPSFFTQTLVK